MLLQISGACSPGSGVKLTVRFVVASGALGLNEGIREASQHLFPQKVDHRAGPRGRAALWLSKAGAAPQSRVT